MLPSNTKWQPLPGFGAAPGSAWAAQSGQQHPQGGFQHPRGGLQHPQGGLQHLQRGLQNPRGGLQHLWGGATTSSGSQDSQPGQDLPGANHTEGPARGHPHPPSPGCQAEPCPGSDRVSAACKERDKARGWQLLVPSAELESQSTKQTLSWDKNVLLKARRYFCCRYCYDPRAQRGDLQCYQEAQG